MDKVFQIESAILNKKGEVLQTDFPLTILREGSFSISVDRIPLVEYFVFFNDVSKAEQVKIKVYKNIQDNKWYDRSYSEEAELHSPEFGIPGVIEEVKALIQLYDSEYAQAANYH
jgi:hypothetical protein